MNRREMMLWIHGAGMALVPLLILIAQIALSWGQPWPSLGLEGGLVVLGGWLPVVVLQWHRPLYPYMLLLWHTDPAQLSPAQRQGLGLWLRGKMANLAVAMVFLPLLWGMYYLAPLVPDLPGLPLPPWHGLGLVVAILALALAQGLLTMGLGAWRLLTTATTAIAPLDDDAIAQGFTRWGWPVRSLPQLDLD